MLLAAVAAFAIVAGAASASKSRSSPHVVVLRCKPQNATNTCTPPTADVTVSAKCHKAGTRVHVPAITTTANAGIRSITIYAHGKKVKTYHFSGQGPTSKVIKGLTITTGGLKHGIYSLKITVTDTRGVKHTITRRFAICKPVPVFTG